MMPELARTVPNDAVNCPAPSRIRNRNPCVSGSRINRLRAAWVVHGPVVLVVIPARCTRREAIPMTKRTWYRRSSAVSTYAKSVATIPFAWERMNLDHDGLVRSRVGLIPAARRIFQAVQAATRCPRRQSSP